MHIYIVQHDAAAGPENYKYAELFKSDGGEWGYFLCEVKPSVTDHEDFRCGFATEEEATDHANKLAWEQAREQAADACGE